MEANSGADHVFVRPVVGPLGLWVAHVGRREVESDRPLDLGHVRLRDHGLQCFPLLPREEGSASAAVRCRYFDGGCAGGGGRTGRQQGAVVDALPRPTLRGRRVSHLHRLARQSGGARQGVDTGAWDADRRRPFSRVCPDQGGCARPVQPVRVRLPLGVRGRHQREGLDGGSMPDVPPTRHLQQTARSSRLVRRF